MPDAAAPVGPGHPLEDGRPAARLAADLVAWLDALPDGAAPPCPPERVDLFTLVGQFAALRHEVNLQTKAARTAVDALAQTPPTAPTPPPAADPDAVARPLVKALIDITDALRLGLAEVEAARARLLAPVESAESEPRPGLFARLFGRAPTPASVIDTDRAGPTLAGIADGYALSVRRADRALEAAGVEPIAALGRAFDPDVMEAVGVAAGPAGTVVAEARRGYRWRGALLRPAQVTVGR